MDHLFQQAKAANLVQNPEEVHNLIHEYFLGPADTEVDSNSDSEGSDDQLCEADSDSEADDPLVRADEMNNAVFFGGEFDVISLVDFWCCAIAFFCIAMAV